MDTDALYWFFSNLKFELSVMENFNLAVYFQDVDILNCVLSLYNINQFIHCFYDIQERELHRYEWSATTWSSNDYEIKFFTFLE